MSSTGKTIEIYKSGSLFSRQRWYWRIRDDRNKKITGTGGEGYFSAWNAKRAATKMHPNLKVVRAPA